MQWYPQDAKDTTWERTSEDKHAGFFFFNTGQMDPAKEAAFGTEVCDSFESMTLWRYQDESKQPQI